MAWVLTRPDPTVIKTPKDIRRLKEKLANKNMAAIDTETTGLRIASDSVVFWSLSMGDDRYFLTTDHLEEFEPVFNDKNRIWVGTHIKYDAHMLANSGFPIRGTWFCTLVMDRLLNPDATHGLKDVYEREFNEKMATFGETFYPLDSKGKPRKPPKKPLHEILIETYKEDPAKVIDYSSLDAWASYRVFRQLKAQLKEVITWRGDSLWDVFFDLEVPFTRVLYRCEREGVQIDKDYLLSLKPVIEAEMEKVSRQLHKFAGEPVNPGSPQQLVELFHTRLKLPVVKRTKGGAPSVDHSVLEGWAEDGSKPAAYILRYRKLSKILGTYVEGLLDEVDANGRVHGSLNQHVTETARLSSSDPNLQQIPRSDGDEFKIRKAFVAKPGYKFGTADYDQLEMFLAAHFSRDKGMIENILRGWDIHAGNASLVWGEPYEDIVAAKKKDPSKEQLSERELFLREIRQFAKVIGFGLNYGKREKRLAAELKLADKIAKAHPDMHPDVVQKRALEEAAKIIATYFERLPGVKKFIERTHRRVARDKYVETILGRRRWLRQVMDEEEQHEHEFEAQANGRSTCWCDACIESKRGERQAVNSIIQGSAADITQKAMIKMSLDPALDVAPMLFQVHDEVAFEIPIEGEQEVLNAIKEDMERPDIELLVPLRCSPGSGANWIEAK